MLVNHRVAGVLGAVQQHGRQKTHAAQRGGLLVRWQKGVEKIAVVALRVVRRFRPAGAGHQPQVLALQRAAFIAVGPAVGQYLIKPQLLQRWHRIPMDRVQQHDQFGPRQSCLLGRHVESVVGVARIQVLQRHTRRGLGRFHHRAVGMRFAPVGVRSQHVDVLAGARVCVGVQGSVHAVTIAEKSGSGTPGRAGTNARGVLICPWS